ncbi:MAG: ribosome-associated translation inhibitor RaiA [Kutzneria sp.]|nr:ribosome-associated translation inhibitor RaiA [Kutzneria sp.]MBV9845912.1 ribosome-associated translation inhibitor RaiA [Kutzneria sp.]
MDIVVKGRNVEVPEHYRVHVADKLARLERYDRKVIRFDVELFHEPNRRQSKNCQRVEITVKGRGPVVRAQACAGDFYGALDSAVSKLESRLRKLHDRRRVHYGRRGPAAASALGGVAEGSVEDRGPRISTAVLDTDSRSYSVTEIRSTESDLDHLMPKVPAQRWDTDVPARLPGQVVREKERDAKPMTIDQALCQMELVGHDFYLFHDVDKECPSVVYRRKGFDYGVIRLG